MMKMAIQHFCKTANWGKAYRNSNFFAVLKQAGMNECEAVKSDMKNSSNFTRPLLSVTQALNLHPSAAFDQSSLAADWTLLSSETSI